MYYIKTWPTVSGYMPSHADSMAAGHATWEFVPTGSDDSPAESMLTYIQIYKEFRQLPANKAF